MIVVDTYTSVKTSNFGNQSKKWGFTYTEKITEING